MGLENFENDPTRLQANKFEPYLSKIEKTMSVKPTWGGLKN